jgi:hypothetical protein
VRYSEPGLGKSTLTVELAARLTRQGSGKVLIISAEDDPRRIIQPRLRLASAILEDILLLDDEEDDDLPDLALPEDIPGLAKLIEARGIVLVVIDPMMAFLGSGVAANSVAANSDQHVRRALSRLRRIAEKTHCAVLLIRHLNKASYLPALYRGGGSIGILGACRTAMIVGKVPGDDTAQVLAMNKTNLGPLPPSLRYRVEGVGASCRIVWDGECAWKAGEIVQVLSEEKIAACTKLAACEEWLKEALKAGPMASSDLEIQALLQGFSAGTLEQARQRVGVKCRKKGYDWEAYLPGSEEAGK